MGCRGLAAGERTGVAGLGDGIAGGRFLNGVERASGKICDHERFAALELDRSLAVREGHGGGGAVLGCVIAAGGAVDLDQEVECGVRVDAFADFLGEGERSVFQLLGLVFKGVGEGQDVSGFAVEIFRLADGIGDCCGQLAVRFRDHEGDGIDCGIDLKAGLLRVDLGDAVDVSPFRVKDQRAERGAMCAQNMDPRLIGHGGVFSHGFDLEQRGDVGGIAAACGILLADVQCVFHDSVLGVRFGIGVGEGQALFRVVGVIAPGDGGVEAVLRVVFRDGNVDGIHGGVVIHAVYEAVHLFHGVGVGAGGVKAEDVKFGAGLAVDGDGLNRRTVCVLEHEGDASGIDRMFSAGGIDLPDLELLGHSGGILIIVRVAVRDDDGIAVGAVDRAGGSERAGLAVDCNRGAPEIGAERFRFLDRP